VVDFKVRATATDATHVEPGENVQNGHVPFLS
jgi:hypothetical protein